MKKPTAYIALTVPVPRINEDSFESIADALYESEGVVDPDLEVDFEAESVTFHMGFTGKNEPEVVVAKALGVARAALHGAGQNTAKWNNISIVDANSMKRDALPA